MFSYTCFSKTDALAKINAVVLYNMQVFCIFAALWMFISLLYLQGKVELMLEASLEPQEPRFESPEKRKVWRKTSGFAQSAAHLKRLQLPR